MPTFNAALVKEQGVTFAVVTVKDSVISNQAESQRLIQALAISLRCPLIVLMGERNYRLLGNRRDVVRFVSSIDPASLPWRRWTV